MNTIRQPDMEFVKCFTPIIFLKFSIVPEKKCVKFRHFGQKNENKGCFDNLSVFLQISTEIQNHLFLAKFPEVVIFALILDKFNQAKNILQYKYCDKFEVCKQSIENNMYR